MAPSRKKGAKAAAAAAARRQWKVGDLVLAKVKGFPAWPATVSEPEKWGYSADWKKVLVYFFGTQQIAFCNHGDVEAFTEEKKESLLGKRHGKGADFVRAVREIIDSYDKLKNQDQGININSNSEATVTNVSKVEAPASIEACIKRSDSAIDKNDLGLTNGGVVASSRRADGLYDRETPSEEHLVVTETPRSATYSRKKLGDAQAQNCVTHKPPSAQRSRSSSRVGSRSLQNFLLPSSASNMIAGNVVPSILQDGSLRRNKRIRRSPDASEAHCMSSPAIVSHDSPEENGSEVVTVDSDTLSFNEGSTVESGYNVPQPDSVSEGCVGDVELSQRFELQPKTVIVKKKRKPSRKRASNCGTQLAGVLEKEAGSDFQLHTTRKTLPGHLEKLHGSYSKEDGDEHLPLVKRARVRMSRPSSSGEQLDASIQAKEKLPETSNSSLGHVCTALNCEEGRPVDKTSTVVKVDVDSSSPLNSCPSNKPPLWEAKKHHQFGCSVDGEAALPPSKRLHRALEAMSANAFVDRQTVLEAPSTMKTVMNGCLSFTKDSSNMSTEDKARNEFRAQDFDSFSDNASQDFASEFSRNLNAPVVKSDKSPEHVFCKDTLVEAVDCATGKNNGISSFDAHAAKPVVMAQSPEALSTNLGKEEVSLATHQGFVGLKLPSNYDCKSIGPRKEDDPSILSRTSLDPVAGNVEITNQDKEMCEVVKESKPTLKDSNVKQSPILEEVTVAAVQCPHLSSTSVFEDHLSHKIVTGIRSSLSPTEGLDSTARVTPPNTSVGNISTSENSNFVEDDVCCSPDIQLRHEKPKVSGKLSNRVEANTALRSFEAILGTLTRTKENIGRATRIAIDCAKFGFAAKVVETLARNLESEPSLHRRVDMFFLVDSITQCSRSLKGDVGGIYTSTFQAVLRLWQERRILPESIIRRHIRDLDSRCNTSSTGAFCRRPLRTERPFDDPVREMEGLVDEYGSNSSFQLPGFSMPPMLKDGDDGSDSDGESFEAVTPEHNSENPEERGTAAISLTKKRSHILEDVDGELEMEDVAPSCDVDTSSNSAGVITAETSHHRFENHFPPPFAPPLPMDVPPSSPPLPKSPPPPPPPPPSLHLSGMLDPVGLDSKLYPGSHNVKDSTQQSIAHLSAAPRGNPMILDAVQYHAPDKKDPPIPMESSASACTFNSLPASQTPMQGVNSFHQSFHLRPPHPAPSNQFSYVQADQRVPSQADVPPQCYPKSFHFVQNTERGNFYSDHDRMNMHPHDNGEGWRFSAPSLTGPGYPDNGRASYAPVHYGGPPLEPTMPNPSWGLPPGPTSYREPMPHRPPSEAPIPVPIRGLCFSFAFTCV
ncbi:hypothetical protein RJ639_043095 [Escallonia herrerae]|uniref:HUA2 n=1 Tax=Escallonia herrerae TaxID=1293975 RepID=A0AA88WCI6_9ASTE|nr:hypothetical protein RJ639_043095 [Escallonia herrerae]